MSCSIVQPDLHSKWKHHNGIKYRVIIITNKLTERPDEYPITVVYQNVSNGTIWSRPLTKWYQSMTIIK